MAARVMGLLRMTAIAAAAIVVVVLGIFLYVDVIKAVLSETARDDGNLSRELKKSLAGELRTLDDVQGRSIAARVKSKGRDAAGKLNEGIKDTTKKIGKLFK